jgi:hypothetical protein
MLGYVYHALESFQSVFFPQRSWVLVDGYLRIEALRCLSRDTARVELWDCPLAQALLLVLVRVQGRAWEAIEEGALLRKLVGPCGLSRREVARQTGRDVSWVSRRLTLLEDLPEAVFAAVCAGELSIWTAVPGPRPVGARQRRAGAESARRPAARTLVYPRAARLVPTLPEGQSPPTRAHAGPTAPVLSGLAGQHSRATGP